MIALKPSLGRGNIKVGPIPTFSLPSRFSCPGASAWCLEHCYAARFERIWPNCRLAYSRNLVLSWDTRRFVKMMLNRIPRELPFFRIHVSGDFYAPEYVEAWRRICQSRSATQFWAYTRSWSVPSLQPSLNMLRSLNNVELFASVDPGMSAPPEGWRMAFIEGDARASGLTCPHQQGHVASCLECGYCFRKRKGNVVFKVH